MRKQREEMQKQREEMRKQREVYKPDLAYSDFVVVCDAQPPVIQICNVGLGAAKDIFITFSMPLDEDLPDFNDANLSIVRKDGSLTFETNATDDASFCIFPPFTASARIDYLLPGKEHMVKLPNYFQEILRLMAIWAFEKEDAAVNELLRKKINLKVSAAFFDVNGDVHHSEYVYSLFDTCRDVEKRTYQFRFK
ncbi:MAG: hypothetical protein LBB60_10950 [Desulfovibrio sp.]|nr:hypothetical protein [Desulfovibrio sp.]